MGWIDNIKHWTDGGLEMAREIARRCQWPEARATKKNVYLQVMLCMRVNNS